MLRNRLSTTLQEKCKLPLKNELLVGVSGGPDSLVLLDVLYNLEYKVIVAHFDHGIRNESHEDVAYVKGLSARYEVPFVTEAGNVMEFAANEKVSIEEAARRLRYRFLYKHAKLRNVSAVVVGHTADDQVETVLMHLIRGSGLDGLSGMQYHLFTEWSSEIPLVRPLLGVWRDEILNYCDEHKLAPLHDQTNQDQTYFRNRIRHDLLPFLEEYNPNFKNLLWKLSETVSEDKDLLDELVDQSIENSVLERSESHVAIDIKLFSMEALGIQRRILRKVISFLQPGLRDIGFNAVEYAVNSLRNPPKSCELDLIAGLRLQIEHDRFIISYWDTDSFNEDWPQLLPGQKIDHTIPGILCLPGDWVLDSHILKASEIDANLVRQNPDPFTAFMDLSKISCNLLIRQRESGDRFKPLGMQGNSVKISDFMINKKLPKRARRNWPLLFSNGILVWVPGFSVSELVKVSDQAEEIVQVVLSRQL